MCLFSGNICYSPAGRSVLGETVPEVVSTGAQDRGQSFSTDLPWTVNNLFLSRFFQSRVCLRFVPFLQTENLEVAETGQFI